MENIVFLVEIGVLACAGGKKCVSLRSVSPNGGIGRRDGLKHRWGDPSRFEPGSGY